MASVPNMRMAAATPAGEASVAAEGEKGDLFARILSLAPVAGTETPIPGQLPTDGNPTAKPETPDDDQSADVEAVDLALPVLPAELIPLIAAQAAAPVVANPASSVTPGCGAVATTTAIATPGRASATPIASGNVAEVDKATTPQIPAAAMSSAAAVPNETSVATVVTSDAQARTTTAPNVASPADAQGEPPVSTRARSAPVAARSEPLPEIVVVKPTDAAPIAIVTAQAATVSVSAPEAPKAEMAPVAAAPEAEDNSTPALPDIEPQSGEIRDGRNFVKASATAAVVGGTDKFARLGAATPAIAAAESTPASAEAAPPAQPSPRLDSGPLASTSRLDAAPASLPTPSTMTQAPSADPARLPDPLGATVERELNLVRDTAWLDQLARDIVRTAKGDEPMRFRLHPQSLGHLKVEVAQTDQGTTVRFTAESEAARSIIADAQPRLTAEARAQGVRIAESQVDLGGAGQDADSRRHETARSEPQIRTAGAAEGLTETPSEAPSARTDRFA